MTGSGGLVRLLGATLILFLPALAAAQYFETPPASGAYAGQVPVTASALAGYWQAVSPDAGFGPGFNRMTMNEIGEDGRFRQTFYFGNQVAGFAEGQLILQPGGGFTQVITNASPLYCSPGGCLEFRYDPQMAGQIVYFANDSFVTVARDARSGKTVTTNWRRTHSPLPATNPLQGLNAMPGAYGMPGGNSAPGGTAIPGAFTPEATAPAAGPVEEYDFLSAYIDALVGERPFTDEYGTTYRLPNLPDPSTNYYSPEGNPLSFNDYTWTWSETDSLGFETDLEPDGYGGE